MPVSGLRRLSASAVAVAVLVVCAWRMATSFAWHEVGHVLQRVDFVRLAVIVLVLQFGYILVRTARWWLLLREIDPRVRYWDLYAITAMTVSLASLTPGQVGEVWKLELLRRRHAIGLLPGLGGFAVERVMDLVVLVALGFGGLLWHAELMQGRSGLGKAAALLAAGALLGLLTLVRFAPVRSPWLARLRVGCGRPGTWFGMLLLTLLAWGFVLAAWHASLTAAGAELSLSALVCILSGVTLGSIVTLVPGGLGVSEILGASLLIELGLVPSLAQSGMLVLRAYGLMVVIFGLAHLIRIGKPRPSP